MTDKSGENEKPTLAVLDWGIGGIDFYRIFKKRYPETGVCYFSDSGAVPYGKLRKEELAERFDRVAAYLTRLGVTRLVVACNAMSTVLPAVQPRDDFQITGVIAPAISAVLAMEGVRVGIVGGRRTILSGAYGKPLRERFPSVTQRIAQPLSALIERGEKETPLFHETLNQIMEPLRKSDVLVLACTHYTAAWEAFQVLAPVAKLVSPAAETLEWLSGHWHINEDHAPDLFYTTGNPDDMRKASLLSFGVQIVDIKTVAL